MLECKVEEIEDKVLCLNQKTEGLEEWLKEEIETRKENEIIYNESIETLIDVLRDYNLESSWIEEELHMKDLCLLL